MLSCGVVCGCCVVIFVLSLMRLVGSIILWVACELVTVFCIICNLLNFVSDASIDHLLRCYLDDLCM